MTKTPHKHAEIIKFWADGEAIEYRTAMGGWTDVDQPAFIEDYEYRVKPARSYPVTLMTRDEANRLKENIAARGNTNWADDVIDYINAGLRHAIDNGQVVPMSEVQETARNLADQLFADQFTKPGQLIAVKQCKTCGGHQQINMPLGDRAKRDMAVAEEVKSACIKVLGIHCLRHVDSQAVLRSINLVPIVEGMKK